MAIVVAMLIVAGAGAAAGAAMAGNISGQMTTEVDQAIVVNTSNPGDIPAKDGFINVNDDGTEFRTATQIYQGDKYDIEMNFTYNGQTDINAELVLDIPEGLNVAVERTEGADDNVTIGQIAEDTWLLNVDDDDEDHSDGYDFELTFTISTDNTVEPGFYHIDGTLAPVDV